MDIKDKYNNPTKDQLLKDCLDMRYDTDMRCVGDMFLNYKYGDTWQQAMGELIKDKLMLKTNVGLYFCSEDAWVKFKYEMDQAAILLGVEGVMKRNKETKELEKKFKSADVYNAVEKTEAINHQVKFSDALVKLVDSLGDNDRAYYTVSKKNITITRESHGGAEISFTYKDGGLDNFELVAKGLLESTSV